MFMIISRKNVDKQEFATLEAKESPQGLSEILTMGIFGN